MPFSNAARTSTPVRFNCTRRLPNGSTSKISPYDILPLGSCAEWRRRSLSRSGSCPAPFPQASRRQPKSPRFVSWLRIVFESPTRSTVVLPMICFFQIVQRLAKFGELLCDLRIIRDVLVKRKSLTLERGHLPLVCRTSDQSCPADARTRNLGRRWSCRRWAFLQPLDTVRPAR